MARFSSAQCLRMLLVALAFAVAAAQVNDDDGLDDDRCYDPDTGRTIRVQDCAHNCCINGECGSESECRAAWVIALIVIGCVVCCGCIVAGLVFCYCTKRGPFKKRQTVTETTYQPGYNQQQPQQQHQQHYPQHQYPADPYQKPHGANNAVPGYPSPPQRENV
ncbi:hypothetical protein DIPPA_28897 [Diplonema papillatum]|nr:hypothetical protein DIPPA_28897 [Diplonema papillatum]|eukprot:gene19663-30300_t